MCYYFDMMKWNRHTLLFVIILAFMVALPMPLWAQSYRAPRTPDDRPDLNGIWQALGAVHWNLEGHSAGPAPLAELGAIGAMPAGLGVVEGGRIPYQEWAAVRQKENFTNRLQLDPAVKCYLPGVPRATYMPLPFQIVQTPEYIFIAYEFAGASRTIYMNRPDMEAPVDTWMGHSRGHWDGETLVVEVTNQVADTWLDRAGNFHSEELRVVERYTPQSPYHLLYEATITDAKVFSKPWTIRVPLYRRVEENIQLLDFRCVEFAEELMYGPLSSEPQDDK